MRVSKCLIYLCKKGSFMTIKLGSFYLNLTKLFHEYINHLIE